MDKLSPLSLYGIPTDGIPSQGHTVDPLHNQVDTALRLRDPHSHHPCGFQGLPAIGGPPMAGVVVRTDNIACHMEQWSKGHILGAAFYVVKSLMTLYDAFQCLTVL
jgi:hypothetical protein